MGHCTAESSMRNSAEAAAALQQGRFGGDGCCHSSSRSLASRTPALHVHSTSFDGIIET